MRWIPQAKPKYRIRRGFLFLPRTAKVFNENRYERRWLEFAEWMEEYMEGGSAESWWTMIFWLEDLKFSVNWRDDSGWDWCKVIKVDPERIS